jgi:hypothetical protein
MPGGDESESLRNTQSSKQHRTASDQQHRLQEQFDPPTPIFSDAARVLW